MPRSNLLFGRWTKSYPVNPIRTIQLSEQTFQVLKEHPSRYYSSPSYDEVLVNLVKFYEQNEE